MSNSKIKKCFLTIISLQKLKVYRLYHLKKLKLNFINSLLHLLLWQKFKTDFPYKKFLLLYFKF